MDAEDARRDLSAAVADLVRARPLGAVDRLVVVVDGRSYVLACEEGARRSGAQASGVASLSPREKQLIELAAAGFEPKVIAYDLGLAPSTVRVLLARAGRKLGARTWRELVAIYTRATSEPEGAEPRDAT